jgi:hypothetical protein
VHLLLVLLILAMLFPTGMRALLALIGCVLIVATLWIGIAFVNFEAERRADCIAHQQDQAWFAAYDCENYVRNADDGRP